MRETGTCAVCGTRTSWTCGGTASRVCRNRVCPNRCGGASCRRTRSRRATRSRRWPACRASRRSRWTARPGARAPGTLACAFQTNASAATEATVVSLARTIALLQRRSRPTSGRWTARTSPTKSGAPRPVSFPNAKRREQTKASRRKSSRRFETRARRESSRPSSSSSTAGTAPLPRTRSTAEPRRAEPRAFPREGVRPAPATPRRTRAVGAGRTRKKQRRFFKRKKRPGRTRGNAPRREACPAPGTRGGSRPRWVWRSTPRRGR